MFEAVAASQLERWRINCRVAPTFAHPPPILSGVVLVGEAALGARLDFQGVGRATVPDGDKLVMGRVVLVGG